VIVDRQGLPLTESITGANRNDCKEVLPLLDDIKPIRGARGRPRRRPTKVHGDKAYDHRFVRRGLHQRHVIPRIARRGIESSQKLGRYRWVVERTGAWLHRFRRLLVRYERRDDIHFAFLQLGSCLILFHALLDWF
jgi:transposase